MMQISLRGIADGLSALPRFSALALLAAGVMAGSPARAADILVLIDGVETGKGSVFMRFCDKGPLDGCQQYGSNQVASAETIGFRFSGIPAGNYAFVAFQDTDSSGKPERNWLGMPKEPFALSNDAGKNLIPPPDYDDLKIKVADKKETTVHLTMQTVTGFKRAKGAPVVPIEKVPIMLVSDPVPPPPTP
jgi:uncharacterized protein (DUF2141 family)